MIYICHGYVYIVCGWHEIVVAQSIISMNPFMMVCPYIYIALHSLQEQKMIQDDALKVSDLFRELWGSLYALTVRMYIYTIDSCIRASYNLWICFIDNMDYNG